MDLQLAMTNQGPHESLRLRSQGHLKPRPARETQIGPGDVDASLAGTNRTSRESSTRRRERIIPREQDIRIRGATLVRCNTGC